MCKRIVKLICHRRSNMLYVSQCCVIERVMITAPSFSFFLVLLVFRLWFVSRVFPIIPRSLHIEILFSPFAKCYSKRESNSISSLKESILRMIYVCYIFYFQTWKRKHVSCPPSQKNIFLEIVRWYINFYVHYLWKFLYYSW